MRCGSPCELDECKENQRRSRHRDWTPTRRARHEPSVPRNSSYSRHSSYSGYFCILGSGPPLGWFESDAGGYQKLGRLSTMVDRGGA
eukprot:6760683-Prymnesium_polylepis.1